MSSRVVLNLVRSSSQGALDPVEVVESTRPGGKLEPKLAPRRLVKRNPLARGLARQYDAQKAREDAYKARLTRQLEQKRTAEALTKKQGFDRRSRSPVRGIEAHSDSGSDMEREGSDVELNADESGVILRLRSLPTTSTNKTSEPPSDSITRATSRSRSLVIPVRHGLGLPRKAGLRRHVVLSANQTDDGREAETGGPGVDGDKVTSMTQSEGLALSSPTDLQPPYPGSGDAWSMKAPTGVASPHHQQSAGSMSHWRPDRSSALVLSELRVTKEIMAREQTLRQLGEAAEAFDRIALELVEAAEAKKTAEAAADSGAARMVRLRRGSSSSTKLMRPDSGSHAQSNAATIAALKQNIATLSTLVDKLTDKLCQRAKQTKALVESLRAATTSIIEGVAEWRNLQSRRRACSNFDPMTRFPWKNGKVTNYMLHLQTDTHALFGMTAIACLIGADAEFNALFLPLSVLRASRGGQRLAGDAAASPSKTFLTDKVASTGAAAVKTEHTTHNDVPGSNQHLYYSLTAALPGLRTGYTDEESKLSKPEDLARWRLCMELIEHELELERRDSARREQDAQRLEQAYNPFLTIKAAGGVDEQLSTLLTEQSPHVKKLRQQLRHRQQGATDWITSMQVSDCGSQQQEEGAGVVAARRDRRLCVSTRRLHQELQRRRDLSEATMRCESVAAALDNTSQAAVGAKRNRLQGQVIVRRQPVPGISREDRLASVIQRQFRAYQARGDVLQSLADLVGLVRASTVNIQRVYRGHAVKLRFRDVLTRRNELRHKRTRAARTIALAFRRYKRRQRHRQSLTVAAIAQAQLQSMLVSKSHGTDDASARKKEETERLRRLGAERRRHLAVMMEQQRRQQLESETAQTAAATRIQSVVRCQQAQRAANALRQEKKAHMAAVSAMAIQSSIRSFLVRQDARRLRFRRDLERVNRSAERIQRVYRDYNLRAHADPIETVEEGGGESQDGVQESQALSEKDQWNVVLPPLAQRPSTPPGSKLEPERVALPPLARPTASSKSSRRPTRQLVTPTAAATVAMTRIELKLKEPVIDFQAVENGPTSARRGSFQGWHGRA